MYIKESTWETTKPSYCGREVFRISPLVKREMPLGYPATGEERAKSIMTIVSTTNWHLTRVLPLTTRVLALNNKGFCPASTELEPNAAIAVDLQQPLREFRLE